MKPNPKFIYTLLLLLFIPFTSFASEAGRKFRVINAADGLANNNAQAIVCTRSDRMIISTLGNLNFYDGDNFNHIDTKQEYQMHLPEYRGNYRIAFDKYHHLWLKNTHSVTCVDLTNEVFIENPEEVVSSLGCNDALLDLFTDEDNEIWFLTDKGLYNSTDKKIFHPLRDRNLQELDVFDGILVTFYDNSEVMGFKLETGQVVFHSKAYDWEEARKFMLSTTKLRYEDGYFLIKEGEEESLLMQFNIRTHQWKILMKTSGKLTAMSRNDDFLYVTSNRGYWVYDINKSESTYYETVRLMNGVETSPACTSIDFDKQGGIWIGTEKRGLLYAPPHKTPFNVYSYNNPLAQKYITQLSSIDQNITEFSGLQANCMYKDSRNWIWVGTTTGLYLYRSPKDKPILFNKKNGLYNNVIHSVVEDTRNNIWISTSCGISCIIFDKEKILFVNNFNQYDDVPSESFVNCKSKLLDDGRIIMQGVDHVIEFHPDSFSLVNGRKMVKMYPKLIQLMINGHVIEPHQEYEGKVILDRAITRVKDINLNASQNSISLTFSGLNYFRPLQTYYRVKIEGLNNNEWKVYSFFNGTNLVDSRGLLHLPLMGLEPGDYEVSVLASMFPDIWDKENLYVWRIHVNLPWWKQSGVYILFASLIFVLIIVNFFLYNRNTRKRVRRTAEEGDMIKKILSFIDMCDAGKSEVLQPTDEELYGTKVNDSTKLSPRFIELMLKITPFVHSHHTNITMRQLSEAGNVNIVEFYDLMIANLYKNPRELIRVARIERAAEMLKETNKTLEEIANECGFYTPNYFIGCFFHRFKLTPAEYRHENA
jgi:AraC-like DNA-binding protein/ligand-binding sensor domain-containing protein